MMKKMTPLTLKKGPQVYEVAAPVSPSKASVYKGYANGCDIKAIITSMKNDQREHQYATMPEPYAKYRRVVAEWMMDVCHYFSLHPTTTHAAVAYLDRLQPNERFTRFEWQMLAIACILIASKYNESEEDVPELRTLEEITQQPIANEEVLNFELLALKRMGWKLNARTPVAFITAYCFAGVVHAFDTWDTLESRHELQSSLYAECVSLATVCLLEERFKRILSSDVASAIVLWVRSKRGLCPAWRKELTEQSLCNPYTPGAQQALAMIKDMFPAVRVVSPPLPTPPSVADGSSRGVVGDENTPPGAPLLSTSTSTSSTAPSVRTPLGERKTLSKANPLQTPVLVDGRSKVIGGDENDSPVCVAFANSPEFRD